MEGREESRSVLTPKRKKKKRVVMRSAAIRNGATEQRLVYEKVTNNSQGVDPVLSLSPSLYASIPFFYSISLLSASMKNFMNTTASLVSLKLYRKGEIIVKYCLST